jgi:pilus assembly protein CpaB
MNRGPRTIVVLVVALVAATAASYGAFQVMQNVSAQQQVPLTVPIVVAARPVAVGTLITPDHVKVVQWPTTATIEGSFATADEVVDRGAVTSFAENEPLVEAKLAAKGMGAGLPPTIPPGMRAISIKVNEVIGVAGFVVPGSRVDVLVTIQLPGEPMRMTRVVVGNVQVLTAGTRIDQDQARTDGKPIPTTVVTLMVSPEDAERIALAQNEGQITLTLRNPLDTEPTATPGVKLGLLLGTQTAMQADPPAAQAPVRRARPAPAVVVTTPVQAPKAYTVEAIRGTKRSEETIK